MLLLTEPSLVVAEKNRGFLPSFPETNGFLFCDGSGTDPVFRNYVVMSDLERMASWIEECDSSDDDDDDSDDICVDSVWCEVQEKGYAVIDDATGGGLAKKLQVEVDTLEEACLLGGSPNALATGVKEQAVVNKRGVFELEFFGDRKARVSDGHVAARQLCPKLRSFAEKQATPIARRLGKAFGARLFVDEVKAQYQNGDRSCFPAHFDTTTKSQRRITCILYLNTDWTSEDGGELRFLPLGPPIDIPPLFDRLVIFSSTKCLHRTLPSTRSRRCVSFWLGANDSSFSFPSPTSCPCFHSVVPPPTGWGDDPADLCRQRALTQLRHHAEYRVSFQAAFPHGPDLQRALNLDDTKSHSALAGLAPDLRRLLTTPCSCQGGRYLI